MALCVDGGCDEGLAVYLELELLREPRHKAQVLHLADAALPTLRVLVGAGSSRSFYLVCRSLAFGGPQETAAGGWRRRRPWAGGTATTAVFSFGRRNWLGHQHEDERKPPEGRK